MFAYFLPGYIKIKKYGYVLAVKGLKFTFLAEFFFVEITFRLTFITKEQLYMYMYIQLTGILDTCDRPKNDFLFLHVLILTTHFTKI